MTLEERLRATMRRHEDRAPAAVHWTPPADPPPPRRLAFAGVMAVGVLLAAGVVAVLWPRPARLTAADALTCPASSTATATSPSVPALPTVPDADARLVPDTTPESVLVCGYTTPDPTTAPPIPLTRSTTLSGDLAAVTAALTNLPRDTSRGPIACAGAGTDRDADSYLIGLTYAGGTVWVSAPDGGGCPGSSNGAFTTTTSVAADAAASLAAGTWTTATDPGEAPAPDDPGASPCRTPDALGRLGQESRLVPGTPVGANVCVLDPPTSQERFVTVPAGRVADLAAAVNALPTRPTDFSCSGHVAGTTVSVYTLTFTYTDGPGVKVSVIPDCTPPVLGGALAATSTGDLLPLLANLTR